MKKGISLIVMLITIVVIIILAASIINTVIYNSPMDNAKEAAFRSDLQEIKYAYGIRQGELMAKYKGDKAKIKEEDYEGIVHKNYEGEILAFEDGLVYLGQNKQKQEIAESMDYIIGNPNDSVLKAGLNADKYKSKITKVDFITNNKVPNEALDSWDVSLKNNGVIMAWIVDDGNEGYELIIGGVGKVIANKSLSGMFQSFTAVKEIDMKALDTSMTTNMTSMFYGCSSLISLNLGDKFNTSNVTDMNSMFRGCLNLNSLNLGDKFDTSNVTSMRWMFDSCSSLKKLDLGDKFDTSNVKDMQSTFDKCRSLTNINLGSKFNTSSVENMSCMFYLCGNLTSINLGSNFDTSSVTTMFNMFNGCTSLTSINIGDKFDTSNVTNMSGMFCDCNKIKTNITIKNSETTGYGAMFSNAATENGAEIKVNYTSETSDLVDKMIKTKSVKSNVIKGNQVNI